MAVLISTWSGHVNFDVVARHFVRLSVGCDDVNCPVGEPKVEFFAHTVQAASLKGVIPSGLIIVV